MYKRDRDIRVHERQVGVMKEWDEWRRGYGELYKKMRRLMRPKVAQFVAFGITYDVTESQEKNMAIINR